MKTLGVIEAQAYIQPSNRSPIMIFQGNKKKSLEEHIRDVVGTQLNIVSTHPRYFKVSPPINLIHIVRKSGSCTSTGSASEILPHTKRIKITVEVED